MAHEFGNAGYSLSGMLGYFTNEVICSASSHISLAAINN